MACTPVGIAAVADHLQLDRVFCRRRQRGKTRPAEASRTGCAVPRQRGVVRGHEERMAHVDEDARPAYARGCSHEAGARGVSAPQGLVNSRRTRSRPSRGRWG